MVKYKIALNQSLKKLKYCNESSIAYDKLSIAYDKSSISYDTLSFAYMTPRCEMRVFFYVRRGWEEREFKRKAIRNTSQNGVRKGIGLARWIKFTKYSHACTEQNEIVRTRPKRTGEGNVYPDNFRFNMTWYSGKTVKQNYSIGQKLYRSPLKHFFVRPWFQTKPNSISS